MQSLILTLLISLVSILPITVEEELTEEKIISPENQPPKVSLPQITLNSEMLAIEIGKADLIVNASLSKIRALGTIGPPLDPDVRPEVEQLNKK